MISFDPGEYYCELCFPNDAFLGFVFEDDDSYMLMRSEHGYYYVLEPPGHQDFETLTFVVPPWPEPFDVPDDAEDEDFTDAEWKQIMEWGSQACYEPVLYHFGNYAAPYHELYETALRHGYDHDAHGIFEGWLFDRCGRIREEAEDATGNR